MALTNLSELQPYVANLLGDPDYKRYSLDIITTQLDIEQSKWNLEARICRATDFFPLVANVYRYQFSGTFPLQVLRATFKGTPLLIKSKEYFDKYSSIDWTTTTGDPQEFMIDLNSIMPAYGFTGPSFMVYPTPTANSAVYYSNSVGITNQPGLGIEYVAPHDPMVSATDTPFTSIQSYRNNLMIPFIAGLGLSAAASILEPDPTKETVQKAQIYRSQANSYLSLVVQMYQGLEEEAPMRFSGGRSIRPGGIPN